MASPAEHFAAMAERIAKIDGAEFAGAVVVVPPGDGEPIAFLTTDPKPDVLQFFAAVETRVQVRKAEVMDTQRQTEAWGRR